MRERRLRRPAPQRADPSGGVPRPPALREPGHAGLCAGRSALPCAGAEPPGDVLPHDRGLPRRHQEAAADAARPAQRGGQRRRLPPHAPPADKAAQGCFRDAAALRLVSAELHPEVLRLRQVRKSLPLRRTQIGRPARRPDPRGRHALEVQRVRRLRRGLLQQRHRRHEAPPAHHPRPGERLQMQQDPLRRLRQAHRAEQLRGHLLGLPHQAPHQAASGGGRSPRQGADRRARGPQGSGRGRKGRCRRAGR